ncbi:16S rRNA (cytosine(967)-C(5))-methyltransferase [Aerosakkonemataceae cyanobacterium BLCC-F154]|uniref:16S rRNA (cytosine(967)-C(5))-methyltransferase n=1 Tax=Floridaenema fluviatile BLCC-F154 TaxID=3153640 RepID=A0ABV4YDQ2_9CYAN
MNSQNARQLAFLTLRDIHKGAYADVALDRFLRASNLNDINRKFATELVYGSVRRQRTLDAIIDQLGKKKAHQQPTDIRTILHLGLYQLRYLTNIPVSAVINTTVELAKENKFAGLSGVVNALLRQYDRISTPNQDPLILPENLVERLGIFYSFPDWIIELWLKQWGEAETEKLCDWMNQTPAIDLRINPLKTTIEEVETAFKAADILVRKIPHLPQALRLMGSTGAIQKLPGFQEGFWTVQDSSAQMVTHLLDPQPGEIIIDACAAPGGKTTHIVELMQDVGKVWSCDRTPSRLKKLQQNAQRLGLKSIEICTGDSRNFSQFTNLADRILLDVPCSGLGTLHRHADARWRQTPENVKELAILQKELLDSGSKYVKPGGILVYSTCTLHPLENEQVIKDFLASHPNWQIELPAANSPIYSFVAPEGWIKVLPHREQMDGFFMVRLRSTAEGFNK